MAKEIWVFAERNGNEPAGVVYELLSKSRALAKEMGGYKVAAVVLGEGNGPVFDKLTEAGAEIIYSADHPALRDYRCDIYGLTLEKLVRDYAPEYLFIGATGIGSELAPTTAGLLKTGLAAHCIDLRWNGERLGCMVPAFGGKVVSEIYIPYARPVMASVRPGILNAEAPGAVDAQILSAETAFLDTAESGEEFLGFESAGKQENDITEAQVVVAAGRGAASDAAWKGVTDLAERLGAAIAWSRALIDTGRVSDESAMIGTSGKSVKPGVLINVGVSGAAQYICGIGKSKTIISINKDKSAKIFEHSDYGVVGDAAKILPALIEKL